MIGQHFAEKSGNPREQRAYTHALLDKARSSEADADFAKAYRQVAKIGQAPQSRKTAASRFGRALEARAADDRMVRRVRAVGNKVLQSTKRDIITWVGTKENPSDLLSASLSSPDFAIGRRGAIVHASALREQSTGKETVYQFGVTDHDRTGDGYQHAIPYKTGEEGHPEVDVVALRRMQPGERAYLGKQAMRVELPDETKVADK